MSYNKRNDIFNELIQDVVRQAKIFLKELGEFYPFASFFDNEIRQLSLFEEDISDINEYIHQLKEYLDKKIDEKEIKAYAICKNVNVKQKKSDNPKDCIEIKINYLGEEYESCFIPYGISNENDVVFGNMFVLDNSSSK